MSGPFDRYGRPDGGREWPAEDLEAARRSVPEPGTQPDLGTASPPGPPSRDWDEWPAITPPDDYYFDEPLLPSSDPWAETWSDDAVPGEPTSAGDGARDAHAYAPPRDEAAWSPPPAPAAPQPFEPVEPVEPDADRAAPIDWPAPGEPRAEPEPPQAWAPPDAAPVHEAPVPVIEPDRPSIFATPERESIFSTPAEWSPGERRSDEPWQPEPSAWEPEAAAPESAPPASPLPSGADEPALDEMAAGGEPAASPQPSAYAAWSRPWTPEEPEWIVDEPSASPEPEAVPDEASVGEPDREVAAPAVADHERETEPLPDVSAEAAAPIAQPVAEPEPQPEPQPDPESEPELDVDRGTADEPIAAVDTDPIGTAADEPASEPITAERATEPVDEPVDEPEPTSAEPSAEAPWAWGPRPDPIAASVPDSAAAADAADDRPIEHLEPIWARPDATPTEADVAGAMAGPDHAYAPPDPTQVFPSSWTPPAPARESLEPVAGAVRTSFGETADEAIAVEHPAVAEQAVPWLIGVILLLAGMVIVLLALIFAGDASLGGRGASPGASAAGGVGGSAEPSASVRVVAPSPLIGPSVRPTPTPEPLPEYGDLELVYQGRSTALAPIYLLLRDFTQPAEPTVLTQDPTLDVRRFTWSRDGTVGAALLGDALVSVEPGADGRQLGEGISAATFGTEPETVYAVRIVQEGTQDTAVVLAIDYASAEETELARTEYARPQIASEDDAQEAQFADDGGTVRLFWMDDDTLWLWVLGAGAWQVDPETGELTDVGDALPVLWAPDRDDRIVLTESGSSTTLEVVDDGEVVASTTIEALVSHVRWSRDGQRVTFTAGRVASGGGVLQDLYLWDPFEGTDPSPLTNTGAAFGAEWRGTLPVWQAPEAAAEESPPE